MKHFLHFACLIGFMLAWLAQSADAALSIRQQAAQAPGGFNVTTTSGCTFTTLNAGDIIVTDIALVATGAHATITSVSDAQSALTFASRYDQFLDNAFGAQSGTTNAFLTLARQWAYIPSDRASDTVTMNFTASNAITICTVITGFTGIAYTTAPWDTDPSLPAVASTANGTSTPSVTGVSTASANGLVYALAISADSNNTSMAVGSGFTNIANSGSGVSLTVSVVAGHNNNLYNEYEVISAALSSATVGFASATTHGWLMVADALAQGVAPAPKVSLLPLMGAGR